MGKRRGKHAKKTSSTPKKKYLKCPQMHETSIQEHDTWANTMLRYTKDERRLAHNAREPNPEHECKTCGEPFLSNAGMKVHRKLAPQCAKDTTQHDQNNNACPNNNCDFRHKDPRQLQAHLFYHCHQKKHTQRTQRLDTQRKKKHNPYDTHRRTQRKHDMPRK